MIKIFIEKKKEEQMMMSAPSRFTFITEENYVCIKWFGHIYLVVQKSGIVRIWLRCHHSGYGIHLYTCVYFQCILAEILPPDDGFGVLSQFDKNNHTTA